MPDIGQVSAFFLVFVRAMAFIISGPLFNFVGVPQPFKVGLPMALAVVLFPTAAVNPAIPGNAWGFGLAVVSEIAVGLLFGVAVTMLLNSFRMAGQMIDLQIGYAMSTLVDPTSGMQNTLLARYFYLLAFIIFMILDGHHALIMGLAKSYQLVPLSAAVFHNGSVPLVLTNIFAGAFTIALQVSAPVLAVLLISDLALGFLSRTTPQINVFLTGFLVKIMVGLLVLSFLFPLFGVVFQSLIKMIEKDLYLLMRALV